MNSEQLLLVLNALDHPQRLRIIEALIEEPVHVSELARRLGLSRPLLYMHLDRLEKANIVSGSLELSPNGRAMKYYQLTPFKLTLTIKTIAEAVRADLASVATSEVTESLSDNNAPPAGTKESPS